MFDAGDFFIPTELRELYAGVQWDAFHTLCWDAIQALRGSAASIADAWVGALTGVSLHTSMVRPEQNPRPALCGAHS